MGNILSEGYEIQLVAAIESLTNKASVLHNVIEHALEESFHHATVRWALVYWSSAR